MAESVRPYVDTIYTRTTLTTESGKGLSSKSRKEKKVTSKTANKDKNLLKRGDTWTCIIYVYDPIKGKKKPEWHGGYATKAEARAAMAKLQAAADSRGPVEIVKMTFGEYVDRFIELNKGTWKPGTERRYYKVFEAHAGPIRDIRMSKITAGDIERLHLAMKETRTLSDRTIHDYLSMFKTVFEFAERREEINKSPFRYFVMPKQNAQRRKAPARDDLMLLIEKSKGMFVHMPILLAIMLGLRRGEVLGLKYEDFNFDNSSVEIVRQIAIVETAGRSCVYGPTDLKTKNSKRTLKVPESLLSLIKEKQAKSDSEYIVCKRNGEYYHPQQFEKEFRTFCDILGLRTVKFHDLRHAFGTVCLNSKVPIKVISEAMGHSSISITGDIYCDVQELQDAPAQTMDEVFGALLREPEAH